jgi:aspartyl-tRNA(Asn)/glutamyl-tRNA(Gln) amidotransferase subunit C
MKLTIDDVRHVAHLARLEIADADLEPFVAQISEILAYVDKLNAVATEDVQPMAQAVSVVNAFREDVPGESYPPARTLANAPAAADDMFEVPKIIE